MAKQKEEIIEINPENNDQHLIDRDITEEMQSSYLDYAMSVIVSRALPDVRDGLKPVQRRIIYAMYDQNMVSTGKFHKSAAVVGEVLKNYHPHGDSSVYEAMVRMAQDFSLRYTLIFPQGNFGSIDGDPAAAMRYTEAKLRKISDELYRDIDHETVDFFVNDLQNLEPAYFPSVLPNILLNGATGIAVGMATNIPPHNLREVVDGIIALIEKADNIGQRPEKDDPNQIAKTDFSSEASIEDLVKHIKGPDFPTGGTIYDQKEIMQAYATGRGRVVTRAKTEIEEGKGGRTRIIVTEIPYMVNKATLVAKIADLVKQKKIEGISDLRDESSRKGMRIMIEIKKDAVAKRVENQLFKFTPLQSTFNANMVALVETEPKLLNLKNILEEFVKHRQKVVVNRTIYFLKKDREREHILIGLKKALDIIDQIIALIRASKDSETAKKGLIEQFEFSEIQAQAILDMQLRKLAALERKKIEEELAEIQARIKDYLDLLASPERIIQTIKNELLELKEKHGDDRKTKVVKGKVGELSDEDLIQDENCIVTISKSGYIKRLKEDTYKKQGRGGKGVTGSTLKEEDEVDAIITCNTHDWAIFFTNRGKAYKLRVWEIPESSRTAKGTALVNFLSIIKEEKVQSLITMSQEDLENSDNYAIFATAKGQIKKTAITEYSNIRSSGIIAINLSEGDSLVEVEVSTGKSEILLTTAQGQSIRFSEKDVRPMGRSASGVTAIKLAKKDDGVVGMVIISKEIEKQNLVLVTERGYGKKTSLDEYKVQNRAGSGILTYKITEKTGKLVAAQAQEDSSNADVLIATASGKIIRLSNKQVPLIGRATQGVRLIKMDESDLVSSVAFLNEDDLEPLTNEPIESPEE